MTNKLSDTLDKLEAYINQSVGRLGGPKTVNLMNELSRIQRFVQENPSGINFTRVSIHLDMLKKDLGMPEEAL